MRAIGQTYETVAGATRPPAKETHEKTANTAKTAAEASGMA
jgi:hypothetical protein